MAEKPYSSRELKTNFDMVLEKIGEVKQDLLNHMEDFETSTSGALQEIKTQTTKTNGRVTSLEGEVQKQDTANQVFRARIYTAVAILMFMIASILIPIVGAFISSGGKV